MKAIPQALLLVLVCAGAASGRLDALIDYVPGHGRLNPTVSEGDLRALVSWIRLS